MKKLICSKLTKRIINLLIILNLVVVYYVILFIGHGNTILDDIGFFSAVALMIFQILRSFIRESINMKINLKINEGDKHMASNIYSEAKISKGAGNTDGNPTLEIEFAGCISEIYCNEATETEIMMFKKGVLAERERVWDRLADILDVKTVQLIKYDDLFNQ